jgi:hypothetical protein
MTSVQLMSGHGQAVDAAPLSQAILGQFLHCHCVGFRNFDWTIVRHHVSGRLARNHFIGHSDDVGYLCCKRQQGLSFGR